MNQTMPNKLTPYQIANAFPDECEEYIPKVLPVLRSRMLGVREKLKYIDSLPVDEKTKSLYRLFIDVGSLKETANRISTYEKTMEILKNKRTDDYLANTRAIASAKVRPIESLYSFQRMKMGTMRIHASCPFHGEDKKPSFVIYRHTNTFHCFTCKASGDAIEFFMKINKVDFKQAVKELSRWST